MTELICIVCPKGCHLHVDEQNGYAVTGNDCPRGEGYGKKELTNPTRTLTSTVRIEGAEISRLPVKTNADIAKRHIFDAMRLLNGITLHAPIQLGDVVLDDTAGTGACFVATRSLPKKNTK